VYKVRAYLAYKQVDREKGRRKSGLPLEDANLEGTKAFVLDIPAKSRARAEPFIIIIMVTKEAVLWGEGARLQQSINEQQQQRECEPMMVVQVRNLRPGHEILARW